MVETPVVRQPRLRPERMAWVVLLISFSVFCLLCVISSLGVYAFLFQSTISMRVDFVVGRGTVGVTESDLIPRFERGTRDMTGITSVISTDGQSQATLSFRDPAEDGLLLVAVTVKRNTTVNIRRAELPRFEWSSAGYEIQLESFFGEVDVLVTDQFDGDFLLSIEARDGSRVHINSSGQYSLIASDTQIRAINRSGELILFGPELERARSIPSGQQGTIYPDTGDILITPAYTDLLVNANFDSIFDPTTEDVRLPERWGCANEQDDMPRGRYEPQVFDGRGVLRLVRADNASSHGETRCIQYFAGRNGISVSQYDYLALRATLFIDYQSLSTCGTFGSECPLMLRVQYIDQDGNSREWFQGFYSFQDPARQYPTICVTCTQTLDHQQINQKAWYTFDTGNLFAVLADRKPASIQNVWFYASGHQYDVYLGEVALLAGTLDPLPEIGGTGTNDG